MSILGGPDIVTEGLILHLDAANSKSYPGSGNLWYDLSNSGNHATLGAGAASPVFDTSNNGTFNFDGSNDFIASQKTASEMNFDKTQFTIAFWIKKAGPPYANSLQGHVGFEPNNTFTIKNSNGYFADVFTTSGARSIIALSNSNLENIWVNLCVSINNTIVTTYMNGILATTVTLNNLLAGVGGDKLTLSGGYGYFRSKSSIPTLYLYNKVLSNNEILQNYNAIKGRFAL